MASRVFARISRSAINNSLLISGSVRQAPLQSFYNGFHSLNERKSSSFSKFLPCDMATQMGLYRTSASTQRCWFSSSPSPQADKETSPTKGDSENESENRVQTESTETNVDSSAPEKKEDAGLTSGSKNSETQSVKKRRRVTKRTAFSDSDSEPELSMEDLVKLVTEKEELLIVKQKEIEKLQDKVLRSYAEMENVLDRTKRETENSKKFGIQNFAKSLLDVADNLGRASSVVKERFLKIDSSKDSAGAVPLLKTLLEGVEMTDKQLTEVLKKFGVEKYEPTNESFDPNRHNAVFQVPDPSKPPGTVAVVLKAGYMIHDRVLRPAEVGVTEASNEMQE